VALIYGQMTEPPGARLRVALTALTVAEYFRDEEGSDTLLFIDNIFRFTQAGSEVSTLLGRMPGRGISAQPGHRNGRTAGAHHFHQERLGHVGAGDLRACRRLDRSRAGHDVCSPGRDDRAFAPNLTELGIYPAVDPLASTSRILDPRIVARSTTTCAQAVKKILQTTKTCRTSSRFSVSTSSAKTRSSRWRARARFNASSRNRSTWPSSSPALEGRYVKIADTVKGFKEIVEGKYDDIPEQAFYMKGDIDEVLEAAEKMKAAA
jgi:F-type H+/Na+-transporting ATPase subunit beta